MKEPSDRADDHPSKSERKRRAARLQKLGKRLIELGPREQAQVPLPRELEDAIAAHRRIRSREAARRQLQFIGKLMREVDTGPIEAALEAIDGTSAEARYEFHQIELWRDRLLADPEALTEYLNEHPDAERQRLRQHLKKLAGATDEPTRKSLARELFRMLRDFEGPPGKS